MGKNLGEAVGPYYSAVASIVVTCLRMVEINGLIIDIRRSSPELQRLAYEEGLFPCGPPTVKIGAACFCAVATVQCCGTCQR